MSVFGRMQQNDLFEKNHVERDATIYSFNYGKNQEKDKNPMEIIGIGLTIVGEVKENPISKIGGRALGIYNGYKNFKKGDYVGVAWDDAGILAREQNLLIKGCHLIMQTDYIKNGAGACMNQDILIWINKGNLYRSLGNEKYAQKGYDRAAKMKLSLIKDYK